VSGVVWVLGAGFSQPLGAPLLRDLLTEASGKRLEATYPNSKLFFGSRAMAIVRCLYAYGTAWSAGSSPSEDLKPGERIWSDPEQFLELLDAAEPNTPQARRLSPIIDRLAACIPLPVGSSGDVTSLEFVRHDARAHVAAECCAFLEGADTELEQWSPFRNWHSRLERGDAVISFNYDRICELLALLPAKVSLKAILPSEATSPQPPDFVPLYKLHGSVDWEFDEQRLAVRRGTEKIQNLTRTDRVGIATPGKTKQSAASTVFAPLWRDAMKRIREASAIVFVGYRFPPSDSQAREEILGAIHENANRSDLLITTALGVPTTDSLRLSELLRFAARRRKKVTRLAQHPLYSQDLFSLWDRSMAFDASLGTVVI
jgi:hypothetical protein